MLYDINNEKQILFLHIPKNAGTSITTWLDSKASRVLTGVSTGNSNFDHVSLDVLKNSAKDSVKSFTVIRNPWDRTVSGYFHMKDRFGGIVGTFDDFVKNLKDKNFSIGNPNIFQNQTDWISSDVDHILRYENLSNDFVVIQEYVGNNDPLPAEDDTAYSNYQEYYTEETQQIVREICQSDIEKFNYAF